MIYEPYLSASAIDRYLACSGSAHLARVRTESAAAQAGTDQHEHRLRPGWLPDNIVRWFGTTPKFEEAYGVDSDDNSAHLPLGWIASVATLGTTLNLSTSSLATTTISLALEYRWRRVSSTSVRSQSVAGAVGFGSATSANSLITGLPNLNSTDTYLQVSSDLTTAGGEVAWLRGYNVTLIAGE